MSASYVRYDASSPTAAAPATAFGFNAVSASHEFGGDPETISTVGGASVTEGGYNEYSGEVEFLPISAAALQLAQRASSDFPFSALTGCALVAARDGIAHLYHGVKFNSLELAFATGQALRATLGWMALHKEADGTPSAPSAPSGSILRFYDAAVTALGAATRQVQSGTIRLENNCEYNDDLDAVGASGAKRDHHRIEEGDEVVTVEFTTQQPIAGATLGNIADDIVKNLAFTVAYTRGTASLTFTLTNFAAGRASYPVPAGREKAQYSYRLVGAPNANNLVIAYSAG